jgi:cyclopropane fatty-acyl-phospholipid synthase-like methyltransferase
MNVEEFYSNEPTEVWQKILYNNHYHFGLKGDENIFENRVRDIYPLIKGSVLDCGCGWGGTSRMIINELKQNVTSVTISRKQFEYIKNFLPDAILSDLNDFVPKKKYNIAIFIDSFLHLLDPKIIIKNFYSYVDSFYITEMNSKQNTFLCKEWMSYFRSKDDYKNVFEECGYKIEFIEDITDAIAFNETMKYWIKNILELPRSAIKGQIRELENMCLKDINTSPKNGFIKLFATKI